VDAGYWAYGDQGYFWVPGTWVMAPEVGLLWTPGYWGWGDNATLGMTLLGDHVGFYGGVAYGFGYGVPAIRRILNHGLQLQPLGNNIGGANIRNVYNKP